MEEFTDILVDEEMIDEEMIDEEMIDEAEMEQEESITNSTAIRQWKLIDVGQEYHLTEDELNKIDQQSKETCNLIKKQLRNAIEMQSHAIDGDDSAGPDYVAELGRKIARLDQQLNLKFPSIEAAAIEILKYGDPVDYIIKVYNRLHVGDTGIGKVLLLSIACQSVKNSEGLQPKLSGPSGKGKTHAAKAMFHLIPDLGYKLEGSLSAKSLFYHPDLAPGTIVFSDDVRISAELEDTLKRAMSNFQQKTMHHTVSKDRKSQSLEIPERISWWLTSVENHYSDELLNRLFGLDVDDSVDQDDAVTNQQLDMARLGEIGLPEDEDDIKVCRAIICYVKSKLFKVDIPFADRIVWNASGDRRNLPRFLDLIRAFATMRFMQRYEFLDDEILADTKDFEDAKVLYEQGRAGLTTKLTKAELRLVNHMSGKGQLSVNDIVKNYMKPNGKPYSSEAIRKVLEGAKEGKGLTDKVPGMLVHGYGGKGDEKKYEIPSFDDSSGLEIVSLKPEA
jgi:hypothetical protein